MASAHPVRRSAALLSLAFALGSLTLAGCSSSSSAAPATSAAPKPATDPRVGLKAGMMDAAEAAWNLRVVSKTPPSAEVRRHAPTPTSRSPATTPSRATTTATRSGTSPIRPSRRSTTAYFCPASQSDVSVYKNLLFVSGEGTTGRLDCGAPGRQGHREQGPAPRHPHLRHHRHHEPEERRQRADLPRLAHPHGAGGPEGQGERLRLRLRLGGRPLAQRAAGLRPADARPGPELGAASGSRSSRCRSPIPRRRRS